MDGSLSLAIPYFYIAHLLLISMRVGAALLFAPIWGHPGIPQPMRVLLVFTISLGIASITPFNPQAYDNPGLVIPSEVLIGLLQLDPAGYLQRQPSWQPTLPSAAPGTWTIKDMLRFARVDPASRGQ